jgi:glycosyltransferase involved in cell wall biosynthesis
MRVLFSVDPQIPVPPPLYGGIERVVDGLIGELRARGHEVGLVAHAASSCRVDALFPWPSETAASGVREHLRHARALTTAVGEFSPDIVHSFSRLAYLAPLLLKRQPALMSYQRQTGGRKLALMAALGGRNFVFTACSEHIAKMGRAAGGRWTAIPNFADAKFYHLVPEVPDDSPLVFLSRIEPEKGAQLAIAAAKRSSRRLIIAGNKVDTPSGRDYWASEIEPHLEPGSIEYVGAVNDEQKRQLLGSAAAMIVPVQWDEPFGIVFAESLACGTPVISCPRGALPEIVRDGVDGFLVRNVEEAVSAIGALGEISRRGCRARCEEKFSLRVVTDSYVETYRRVCCV